jgi:hypothetical protein
MSFGSGDLTGSASASFSPISELAAVCHRSRRLHQLRCSPGAAAAPWPTCREDADIPIRHARPVPTSRVVLVVLATGRALPSDGPENSGDLLSGGDLRQYAAARLLTPVHHVGIALPCGRILGDHDALWDHVKGAGTPHEVLSCRVGALELSTWWTLSNLSP